MGLRRIYNSLEYRQDWDKILPAILLGIQTSIARGTKFTPAQLLMGRNLVLPGHNDELNINHQIGRELGNEPILEEIEEYYEELVNRQRDKHGQII